MRSLERLAMISNRDIKAVEFCIRNSLRTYGVLTNQAKEFIRIWASEIIEDKLDLESCKEDLDTILGSLKSNFKNNRYFYFKKFDFMKVVESVEDSGIRNRLYQVCGLISTYKTTHKLFVIKSQLKGKKNGNSKKSSK